MGSCSFGNPLPRAHDTPDTEGIYVPRRKREKEATELDGIITGLHDLKLGAVSELDNTGRVWGRPASMPHSLTITLAGMNNGLIDYGTPTPVHKCKSGRRETAKQGNGLVLWD